MVRHPTAYMILLFCLMSCSYAQVSGIVTYHNNNARTGLNAAETVLTLTNVNVHQFGSLRSPFLLDGDVHAQVLYVSKLTVAGAVHNVVFVATEHDSVYAFDADGKQPSSTQPWLWKVTCLVVHGSTCTSGAPAPNVSTVPCQDLFPCRSPLEIGITATPVISLGSGAIYFVSKTRETTSVNSGSNCISIPMTTQFHCYYFALHVLNLTNGTEKPGSPVIIDYPGSSTLPSFSPLRQNSRSALLLANGNVYVAFGSRGDIQPYSGWIFAYKAGTLALATPTPFVSVPMTAEESCPIAPAATDGGGIWSVGALAADSSGNLFLGTGQGVYNGSNDFGDTFMKLSGTTLIMADFFTPFNENALACNDWDAGSGSPVLLPPSAGSLAVPNLMLAGTKEGDLSSTSSVQGRIYLINRDKMGGHSTTADNIVKELKGTLSQPYLMFNSPAYWNNHVYLGPAPSNFGPTATPLALLAFSISNATLSSAPVARTAADFVYAGANPSVSSNGNLNGIVWALSRAHTNPVTHVTVPAALHAFNAANLSAEIYNSSMNDADVLAGDVTTFTLPTIANGKVYATVNYLPTAGAMAKGKLYLFGLLPTTR